MNGLQTILSLISSLLFIPFRSPDSTRRIDEGGHCENVGLIWNSLFIASDTRFGIWCYFKGEDSLALGEW